MVLSEDTPVMKALAAAGRELQKELVKQEKGPPSGSVSEPSTSITSITSGAPSSAICQQETTDTHKASSEEEEYEAMMSAYLSRGDVGGLSKCKAVKHTTLPVHEWAAILRGQSNYGG